MKVYRQFIEKPPVLGGFLFFLNRFVIFFYKKSNFKKYECHKNLPFEVLRVNINLCKAHHCEYLKGVEWVTDYKV